MQKFRWGGIFRLGAMPTLPTLIYAVALLPMIVTKMQKTKMRFVFLRVLFSYNLVYIALHN